MSTSTPFNKQIVSAEQHMHNTLDVYFLKIDTPHKIHLPKIDATSGWSTFPFPVVTIFVKDIAKNKRAQHIEIGLFVHPQGGGCPATTKVGTKRAWRSSLYRRAAAEKSVSQW